MFFYPTTKPMTIEQKNPWEEIPLSDYENHMRLDSVKQLQVLNRIMRRQFAFGTAESVMILGIAGGNGLEHLAPHEFERVYGVDINQDYLRRCKERHPQLEGVLECVCADLTAPDTVLPNADLLIADLLIEYIGYECFSRTMRQVHPQYVSCIIQINADDRFVSDSPYLHVFDKLEQVHHRMQEEDLTAAMRTIGYKLTDKREEPLPNGKKLMQMDFVRE